MEHYYNLISKFKDTTWEKLTESEKDRLIHSYILYKDIRLPSTPQYKEALLSLFRGNSSATVGCATVDYIRYVIFTAIKQDIELDMDKEYVFEDEENNFSWLQQNEEQHQYENEHFSDYYCVR